MAYEVARVFNKRETEKSVWSGRVGSAALFVSDDGIWTLDGEVLPRTSIEYLMNFSLQSLQDAYAGADDLAEATGNWQKKYDALVNGTIGERSGGVDEETKVARKIVLGMLVKKYGKDSPEAKASDDELDAKFEKNREKLQPVVDAEIARLAAARKEKAAIANMAADVDTDL